MSYVYLLAYVHITWIRRTVLHACAGATCVVAIAYIAPHRTALHDRDDYINIIHKRTYKTKEYTKHLCRGYSRSRKDERARGRM